MFCKYCGSQIDDDALFCSGCGKSQGDSTVPEPSDSIEQMPEISPVSKKSTAIKDFFSGLFEKIKIIWEKFLKGTKSLWNKVYTSVKEFLQKNKKACIITSIAAGSLAVVAVFCFIILPVLILPNVYLGKAEDAFAAENYAAAITYYEKSEKALPDTQEHQKYMYSNGKNQFDNGEYYHAAASFDLTNEYLDSEELIYQCGLKLIDSKNYADAAAVLKLTTFNDASIQGKYAEGMDAYSKKSFSDAIDLLEPLVDKFDAASEIIPAVYFDYGKSQFEAKSYTTAQTYFEKAGTYADAETYYTACDLMLAEKELDNGNLNAAKKAYSKLPKDFEFEGIKVSERNAMFNKYSAFLKICGKWKATKQYIESRNVHISTGIWDSWYYDSGDMFTDQYVDIRCYLNDDGTITIKGDVLYYRFNDFSSLSAYCYAKSAYDSFTVSNVTKVPSSITLDSNTKLKYSGGKFTLAHSVRDDYSVNFYNRYKSDITYGKRSTAY